MLAATMSDLVIGLDVHFELVQGVPVPFPHPFVGRITSVHGKGSAPDSVRVNGVPAANVGSVAELYLPHVCLPPGLAFAPIPMAPVVVAGRARGGIPGRPPGDAIVAMGSKTVTIRGYSAARMTDMALTCSEPTRMPGSVIALPKGNAVMIGGPPAVDEGAGWIMALPIPQLAEWWRGIGLRVLRNLVSRAARQFTGHPVCVSTGQLLAQAVDFTTPGPVPFVFERRYDSNASDVAGSLGHGWSSALDAGATLHPGEIRVRWLDGRIIPFDTFHRPGHVAHVGDTFEARTERSALRVLGPFRYEIRTAAGAVVELAPCPSGAPRARVVAMRRRDGAGFTIDRDASGNARRVVDAAGRPIELSHDEHGRITRIAVPHPIDDACVERVRYGYDARGDLVEVRTPDGATTRYEYDRHLLVRETDATGLSFCFGYDGGSASASCVRTWGTRPIVGSRAHYDHTLTYAKRSGVTVVRDSLGRERLHRWSPLGLPTEVVDPLGASVRREWDDRGRLVAHTDALGGVTRFDHDARGNLARTTFPDGRAIDLVHDEAGAIVARIDPGGGRTSFRYDALGHLVAVVDPTGVESRFEHQSGELSAIESAGSRIEIDRDAHGAPVRVRSALGERAYRHDRRGRPVWMRDELGAERRYAWDEADRLVSVEQPDGETVRLRYDACGNLVEQTRFDGATELVRAGYHRLVGWRRGDIGVHTELDSEDDVAAVVDRGSGARFEHERDAAGRIVATRDPDGRRTRWDRDAAGRIVARRSSDGRETRYAHGACGQLLSARFHDGTELAVAHDARGDVSCVRVTGPTAAGAERAAQVETRFEHDAAGRVTRESTDGVSVDSRWDARGVRVALRSSLGADVVRAAGVPGLSATLEVATPSGRHEIAARVMAAERRTELRLPGDVVVVDGLDPCGRVVSRSVRREGGREIAALGIERAPGGRPLAHVDATTGSVRFELDVHGRLAGRVFPDGTRETRIHDDAGDVYERSDRGGRRYGPGGRLEEHEGWSLVHDEDGRLVERAHASAGTWRYTWDAQGNLVGVELPSGERVAYAYDALRRLTGARTSHHERRFVWDGPRLLHVLSTAEPPVQWVYLPNAITPCARVQAGRWWSLVRWGLGFLVLDERGAEIGRVSLDLFGRATATGDDVLALVPFRFPGQLYCEMTGLVHNRFRWYDPSSGLYLSPDPLGVVGGTRPYGYVIDPVTQADPTGLRPCAWIAGLAVELDFVPGMGAIGGMAIVVASNGQSGIYPYGGPAVGFGTGLSVQALGGFGPSDSTMTGWGPAVIGSYGPFGASLSSPPAIETDPTEQAGISGFRTGTAGSSFGTPSLIGAAPVTHDNVAPDAVTAMGNRMGQDVDQSVVEPAASWLGQLDRGMRPGG